MEHLELETDGSGIPKELQEILKSVFVEDFFLKDELEHGFFIVEEICERLSGVFDPGKWCDLQENKPKVNTNKRISFLGGVNE